MDNYFIVLAVTVCSVLVLVYLYLFLYYRDKSLVLWGLSGTLAVGEFLLDVSYNHLSKMDMSVYLQFIDWQLLFLSSLFMIWGTYLFVGKTMPGYWLYGLLGGLALTLANVIYFRATHFIVISVACQIAGMVVSGILLLTYREIHGLSKYITGCGLIIWGIQNVISCKWFGQIQPTYGSAADYLAATVLGLVCNIGLLLIYYQKRLRENKEQKKAVRFLTHELKNQAMTIRNYSQSILDGIYPRGSLEGSIHLINSEADEMEKRVRDLLYLDKLDYYMAMGQLLKEPLEISSLIRTTMEQFSSRRPELNWKLDLVPITIIGDPQQMRVVFENLLDNQTRYAAKRIEISNRHMGNSSSVIRIWNDGPAIEPEQLKTLFAEYKTGQGGEFGLGLAMVKKIIIEGLQGKIRVVNEDKGVAFYLELSTLSVEKSSL